MSGMKNEAYEDRYMTMSEEERCRNYLAVDLDLVIGGKAELLLELLDCMDGREEEMSLTLQSVARELREILGLP